MGDQEANAEERMFNHSPLLDYPLVAHDTQFIHLKESQGCECDMAFLMKGEDLL